MDKLLLIFVLVLFSGFISVHGKMCKVRNDWRLLHCHCYTDAMSCNAVRILSLKHLHIPHYVKVVNLKYNHINEFDMEFIRNNPNVKILDITDQTDFNCNSLEFVENVTNVNIISDCGDTSTSASEKTVETEDLEDININSTPVKTSKTIRTPTTRKTKTVSSTIPSSSSTSPQSTKELSITTSEPELTSEEMSVTYTAIIQTEAEDKHIKNMIVVIIVVLSVVGIVIIVTCVYICMIVVKWNCICNGCTRIKVACSCIEEDFAVIPMVEFVEDLKEDGGGDNTLYSAVAKKRK